MDWDLPALPCFCLGTFCHHVNGQDLAGLPEDASKAQGERSQLPCLSHLSEPLHLFQPPWLMLQTRE